MALAAQPHDIAAPSATSCATAESTFFRPGGGAYRKPTCCASTRAAASESPRAAAICWKWRSSAALRTSAAASLSFCSRSLAFCSAIQMRFWLALLDGCHPFRFRNLSDMLPISQSA